MRLVRQRFQPQGQTASTDSPANDGHESMEESDHEQPATIPMVPQNEETLGDLVQLLKTEHGYCLE